MDQESLRSLLACPWCLGRLHSSANRLTCVECQAAYSIEDGIPRLVVEDAELFCRGCRILLTKHPPVATCAQCGRSFRVDRQLPDHPEK